VYKAISTATFSGTIKTYEIMAKRIENLKLQVRFNKPAPDGLKLSAVLFDESGKRIEHVPVKNEEAVFKSKPENIRNLKMLILPHHDIRDEDVSFNALQERHEAYAPVLSKNLEGIYEILPIPDRYLELWIKIKCRVTGNVSKFFDINGFYQKKGLCNVRVHICEVDKIRLILPLIPDDILVKIPDLLIDPELPIPVPVNPPFPDPQFGVLPPRIRDLRLFDKIFDATGRSLELKSQGGNESARVMALKDAGENIARIQDHKVVTSELLTRDPNRIRKIIAGNFDLFHPLFCIIPWFWPYFYRCDELAVVYTDINGNFDTNIYYSLFGDHPDLYFWVEAFIDGAWTTVYKPSKPCHTYWYYVCGTSVYITVTDPRVRWECNDTLGGKLIWVKTIGHGTSVSHIQQNNAVGSPIQGTFINRIGLTDKHGTVVNFRRPFGKNLYFILQFSSQLPSNQYTYYRWSYRKIRNADLSYHAGSTEQLSNTLYKQYSFTYLGGDGHFHFDVDKFKLGPFDVNGQTNLFRIPTVSPKDAPFNAPQADADWDQNTVSVHFDSSLEGDGLYEFRLELFDQNGNKVMNIPKELFQVPHYDTFAPSVDAPSINIVSTGANTCSAFKMVMRIDNSHCQADIYKIKVNGLEKNPTCCGFVAYPPNADIEVSFRAYHPHNFADFNFVVKKGTCNDPTQTGQTNVSGMVLAGANGYSRNAYSIYSKTFKPNDLLGICTAEGKAAFAEHLYVNALATTGNDEIDAYDASALAAFALEPS